MHDAPTFRRDLNLGTAWLLPDWSAGPRGDARAVLEAARAAGYGGIQGGDPAACRELGLVPTTFGVLPRPGGLADQAKWWADQGFACATVHLGTGMEDDAEADRLVTEVLEASATTGLPIYVETHRATITQDLWRTAQLVARFPELRLNGDFSHWYTGLEMTYGDFDAKVAFLAPVFARVRYLHGRIGTSGAIQVDVGDGGPDLPHVAHFRTLWTAACRGFLDTAVPGETLAFAPELLPAVIGYAREIPTPEGPREEGDRWTQALVLCRIFDECAAAAAKATT